MIRLFGAWVAVLAVFVTPARGDEKPGDSRPNIRVYLFDDNIDASGLEAKGFAVSRPKNLGTPAGLPPVRERDQGLLRAGLGDSLTGWDELDKDRLWMAARSLSPAELAAKYPALDPGKLKQLSEIVSQTGP